MFGKKLGEIYIDIKGRLGHFKSALAKAGSLASRGMAGIGRIMKKAAKGLGIILAAGVIGAIKAFADFEQQMAKVATMLTKQTRHYLPAFGRAIKDLAVKFGESTATISEGLYQILSASVHPVRALKVLTQSMKAAKAGFTDTATAAKLLTSVLNAYGYAAKDVGKVSDILFSIQKRGQTSFAEFAHGLGRVTSMAAALNVPLEEVAAALATLTRNGISTSESITYLRSALVSLSGRSEGSIKAAKELGITLSAAELQSEGLTGMMEKLKDVSADQLKNIVTEVRARTGLNVLLNNSESYLDDLNLAMNSAGLTEDAFGEQTDTLSYKFGQFWQSIKTTAAEIGAVFGPKLKMALDKGVKNFNDFRLTVAAIWEGTNEDFSEFWKVFGGIAEAELKYLVQMMGYYGRKAGAKLAEGMEEEFGRRHKYLRALYRVTFGTPGQITRSIQRIRGEYAKQNKNYQEQNKNRLEEAKRLRNAKIGAILKETNLVENIEKIRAEEAKKREKDEKELQAAKEKADKAAKQRAEKAKQNILEELELEKIKQRIQEETQKREERLSTLGGAAEAARVRFVGFESAWKSIATQIGKKDTEQKQLKAELDQLKKLGEIVTSSENITDAVKNIKLGLG